MSTQANKRVGKKKVWLLLVTEASIRVAMTINSQNSSI